MLYINSSGTVYILVLIQSPVFIRRLFSRPLDQICYDVLPKINEVFFLGPGSHHFMDLHNEQDHHGGYETQHARISPALSRL